MSTFHTIVYIWSPSAGSRMCCQGSESSVWRCTNHLFLVLWNKLFSWSAQQLVGDLLPRDLFVSMNSVQPGSVYIFSALAIAIVVAMELETPATVQASLLLRCGDIELNPGPLGREGEMTDVDQSDVTYTDWCLIPTVDLEKVDNSYVLSEFIQHLHIHFHVHIANIIST